MKSYATNRFDVGDKVFYVTENNDTDVGIRMCTILYIDFYENCNVYTLSDGQRRSKNLYNTYEEAYENGEFK